MRARQKKKNFKNYHRQFCHTSWEYEQGYSKNKYSESTQCPNCGWDSLMADENLEMGKILWSHGGFYDHEFEVEYRCPLCGTTFSYVDGV